MLRRFVPVLFALALLPAMAFSQVPPDGGRAAALVGETLQYEISLLWFDRAAQGRLSFTRGDLPGTFRAELSAETLGMAALLTGDRTQRYISIMEQLPDGRMRSLSHQAIITKGKGENLIRRGKRYYFDYREGEVLFQRLRGGQITDTKKVPLDRRTPPNDILTAFFNFRTGAFGPLRPGMVYVIPAFSHKGVSNIIVETLQGAERQNHPFFPEHGLLAKVTVDPEIFDTGGGHVYVWFDDGGRPGRGIVQRVVGIGDAKGIMVDP